MFRKHFARAAALLAAAATTIIVFSAVAGLADEDRAELLPQTRPRWSQPRRTDRALNSEVSLGPVLPGFLPEARKSTPPSRLDAKAPRPGTRRSDRTESVR
jgi:hypothetical protein